MNRRNQTLLCAAVFALLPFYPKLFGAYFTNLFVTFAVFAAYSVSLNMLLGFTGLLSFGHAMFFEAGRYGTALALKHIPGLPLIPLLVFILTIGARGKR
jgi:branched-chain amino acid transport system permease protein